MLRQLQRYEQVTGLMFETTKVRIAFDRRERPALLVRFAAGESAVEVLLDIEAAGKLKRQLGLAFRALGVRRAGKESRDG